MNTIDISATADIDAQLIEMLEQQNPMAKEFGLLLYADLSQATKKLYHHIYPRELTPAQNAAKAQKYAHLEPFSSFDLIDSDLHKPI